MQTYLKTKPAWMQLLLFLGVAFGLFVISTFIGLPVLSKMTGISVFELQDSAQWDLSNPAMMTFIRGMILLQFLFLFTVPALLFSYFSDPYPMQYLGLRQPSKAVYWILGIAVILIAYPFVEYVGYWNQKVPISGRTGQWMKGLEEEATKQIAAMLKVHTPAELLKNIIFIALFAGIGEELFFRGILQRLFIRLTKNPWMGIVLTAAIFSGIHFQFYGFFPRLLLGILLGAVYWYSGSLWVAILCHFLYDAAVIVLIYFNPQLLQSPEAGLIQQAGGPSIFVALASLAFTVMLLLQMHKQSIASWDDVYGDDFPPKDNFSF
jgi:membrane protease YdiL (CAAX protease family)